MVQGPAGVIYKHFEEVTDPRANRGCNHNLVEMIFMTLTATICGANGWADVERFVKAKADWFAQYISLAHGVPSHDTFGRVFARLDTAEFLTAMHRWVDEFAGCLRGHGIAIDGKTLRGSFDRAANQLPLHTITAFATGTRTCLRQMTVPGKSNEIPAVPLLLKLLELDGATVTLDAMHCQVETAQAILNSDAHYILTVKANQPTLFEYLTSKFDEFCNTNLIADGLKKHVTTEKSHGRKERREYCVIAASAEDKQALRRWPGLTAVGVILRQRVVGEVEQTETEFFITSHAPKVKSLAGFLRGHWGIENSQHHVLDVTFAEDASRIRRGTAPEISAAIRRMALNILQRDTTVRDNIRGKRLRAGWDESILDQIWAGFSAI